MTNNQLQDKDGNYPHKKGLLLLFVAFIILLSAAIISSHGCGTKQGDESSEQRIRNLESEMSILIEKHQQELQAQYEKGFTDGFEKELDAEQQEIYKKGEKDGYAQGLLIGREEAKSQDSQKIKRLEEDKVELEKTAKQKAAQASECEAKYKKLQNDINELSRKLQTVQAEKDTLISKFRRVLERIDQYEFYDLLD